MRELGPGLWVVETPLRAFGMECGRRMTVVRLARGGLWLHSPAPLTDRLRASLEALGEPRFVVAPSALHGHVFMEQYRDAYPSIELAAGPGLDRRRKDLAFDALLGSVPDPRWSDDLDQIVFLGGFIPEVVFLHRMSRTMIVADLVQKVELGAPGLSLAGRLAWGAYGVYGTLATDRIRRVTTRNRRAARRSLEQMLAWDFDRVILGHGRVIETGGRAALTRAMDWLEAP
jgi:hypothetical protein